MNRLRLIILLLAVAATLIALATIGLATNHPTP